MRDRDSAFRVPDSSLLISACALIGLAAGAITAQEYKSNLPADHPAIQYTRTPGDDAAARLARELEQGSLRSLTLDGNAAAVVRALLPRLDLNADSQMLVFSKTSVQAARISPERPRAIYFNDDVAIAYVPGAPTLEIAAVDPQQGPVFYVVSIDASGHPAISRGDACLRCHQGPNTAGVPGMYVGSVIPGPTGAPLGDASAIITDHRTPFRDRWGGWYVTARRGEERDRANAVASNPADPETLVRESRQNLTSVPGLFDRSAYLSATSDIVALMTFEHQTQMTNLITRVSWEWRMTQAGRGDAAGTTLDADVEDLVAYMLFAGEAPLKESIEGVSSFTRTFSERGPRDHRGRSLRDFDLRTRLFRYPLSYMIYSAGFDALPDAIRERVYHRLFDVLSGADRSRTFAHMSAADRRAILEILRDTKKGLPDYFREAMSNRGGR
jgi:hypothetical protein